MKTGYYSKRQWKEFDNKIMKEYLKKTKLSIYLISIYPQSQGSVEEFNKTIQNFLISAKDSKMESLILKTEWIFGFL